ncbi:zinc finger, CCHC-type containing protein [Tanacetum coccineum]
MDVAAMKHMTSNFAKLDKFEGVDFIRRQKKMHFLLSSMSVVYVLTNLILEDGGDDATVEQIKKRNKTMEFLDELTLVELGSHLRIEESLRVQDSDKPKSNNVAGPQNKKYFVTFIDDASRFCYVSLLHTKDEALDKLKVFKTEVKLHQRSLIKRFRTDRGGLSQGFWGFGVVVVKLPDPKLKTLGERGIECIFVGYAEHSKAFRFYVIEPNESVSINSIIELRDVIFDENRFSSVTRHSLRSPNGTEDIGGSVILEEVTKEVVTQQPEPELRKGKRNRTPKDFGPEFQLYLIEETRDENQLMMRWTPSWATTLGCWLIYLQGFKQKSEIDYFDTYSPVARISTIRLLIVMASIHNLVIYQMDVKTTFLNGDLDEEVYMNQPQGFIMPGNKNKEFLSSRFSMKEMREADVILVSTPIDTSERSDASNNGRPVKWRWYTSNPGTQQWQAIQREDTAYSCPALTKKSTMEMMSIRRIQIDLYAVFKIIVCVYSGSYKTGPYSKESQYAMYNGKSRHLGVRHSMIRELITNGVISIKFVKSQQNLADHLTKGLAINGLKHMYLHIIPRMCLEPAKKEDEVVNFLMVNFFEKVLSRSMNKEEPPM